MSRFFEYCICPQALRVPRTAETAKLDRNTAYEVDLRHSPGLLGKDRRWKNDKKLDDKGFVSASFSIKKPVTDIKDEVVGKVTVFHTPNSTSQTPKVEMEGACSTLIL